MGVEGERAKGRGVVCVFGEGAAGEVFVMGGAKEEDSLSERRLGWWRMRRGGEGAHVFERSRHLYAHAAAGPEYE